MKKFLLTVLSVLCMQAFSQQFSTGDEKYIKNVTLGLRALENQQYDSCVYFYSSAFEITQTSYLSTLRMAACAFSSGQTDEFQRQLKKAFEISWSGAKQVFDNNAEFAYLAGTAFEDALNENWQDAADEAGVNLELMNELAEIRDLDQAMRSIIVEYGTKYGWGSPKMDSLWFIQLPRDKANMERIAEIIEMYGYPGSTLVGEAQSGTAFLVIQHAELEDQEKYLPVLKDAAERGELSWSSVALLIDRVNIRNDKKQIYGSQVTRDQETGAHYFLPIENPHKIDSIRSSVGLGPIQDYADNWQISWDPEKHLKRQNKKGSQ